MEDKIPEDWSAALINTSEQPLIQCGPVHHTEPNGSTCSACFSPLSLGYSLGSSLTEPPFSFLEDDTHFFEEDD